MDIPVEFKERMRAMLGDEYDEFIKSYDNEKNQGMRINTLKVSVEEFLKICPFEIQGKIKWEERGFYINAEKPGRHPYHAAGLFYMQEPSAMSVVPNLNIRKGERVLDLCAAPGGKSTQAASYLEGAGILVSNEIDTKRSRILSENIERMGIRNAVVTNNSPNDLEKVLEGYFDKIVVDAPCSGEGMFRKEEEAIKNWSIENVVGCSIRQEEILHSASKLLKPEGYIVYSTCTFSMEENEFAIEKFLKEHRNFEVVNIPKNYGFVEGLTDNLKGAARLFPHRIKGEGHFVCLLRKTDGEEINYSEIKSNVKKEIIRDYLEFESENLNINIEDNLYLLGDNLFALPKGLPDLKGIKFVRSGLHLGTLKKNRFEPNHALALYLNSAMVKRHIDFRSDSDEIISYLKGNTLNVDIENGWCLITVDGQSIGWGKVSGKILKNHYPKGLRW